MAPASVAWLNEGMKGVSSDSMGSHFQAVARASAPS
jgi:hypothetical protein